MAYHEPNELLNAALGAIKKTWSEMSLKDMITHSLNMNGLFTTFLGYLLGAIPVIVITNARSIRVRCIVTIMACFILGSLVFSAQFPDNILLVLGASVSIVCTFAQVESWKMVTGHVQKGQKTD